MWRMRFLDARRGGIDIQKQMSGNLLERVAGDFVLFIAGLALAGTVVKTPVMPGTHHIVAIQCAFAQGSARVIAAARECTEYFILNI